MDRKLGGLILMLAAWQASAAEPVQHSVARPYFDCMERAASTYGRVADDPDDAIAAASADCYQLRQELHAHVIDHWIGQNETPYRAESLAKGTLRSLDDSFRPHFVRAALRGKKAGN